jgi:hypothetical protein
MWQYLLRIRNDSSCVYAPDIETFLKRWQRACCKWAVTFIFTLIIKIDIGLSNFGVYSFIHSFIVLILLVSFGGGDLEMIFIPGFCRSHVKTITAVVL